MEMEVEDGNGNVVYKELLMFGHCSVINAQLTTGYFDCLL